MEFFGLTLYGLSDPIRDMMRPGYVEPKVPPDLLQLAESLAKSEADEEQKSGGEKKRFAELIREIDVYTGRVDGYAYGSCDRLRRLRFKGFFKPVGPTEMYRYPGCTSMQLGWWTGDECLKGEKWFRPREHYTQPVSDLTRFVQYAMKTDKLFRL